MPDCINLETTHQLHEQLQRLAQENPGAYHAVSQEAAGVLDRQGTKFEGNKTMAFALSALCLDQQSNALLKTVGETLHEIVEAGLDWVLGSDDRLARFFPDHLRMAPWLRKTRGLQTWQGVSRYDAVIQPDGGIRILELNTGCPAGFLHSEEFCAVTESAMKELVSGGRHALTDLGLGGGEYGAIPAGALTSELLATEIDAEIAPGLIGLINDENGLQNELELIAQAFRKNGREASIINAADIVCADGPPTYQGTPISLMYNKIRISTENSPKHHWSPGFQDRYAGFLYALQNDSAVAVNNLTSLTIAEDKGFLEILRLPEFREQLTDYQNAFVDEYVLWTVRFADRQVEYQGETIDLLPFVRANKDRLVIKPANEGRGFGVVVGKFVTQEEWEAACRMDPNLPCVVQEFAEPARLPVVRFREDQTPVVLEHHLTLGLAVLRGKSQGILSRISTNPVTNVGREGVVQAVFLSDRES